jgi:hypothetical protein
MNNEEYFCKTIYALYARNSARGGAVRLRSDREHGDKTSGGSGENAHLR